MIIFNIYLIGCLIAFILLVINFNIFKEMIEDIDNKDFDFKIVTLEVYLIGSYFIFILLSWYSVYLLAHDLINLKVNKK